MTASSVKGSDRWIRSSSCVYIFRLEELYEFRMSAKQWCQLWKFNLTVQQANQPILVPCVQCYLRGEVSCDRSYVCVCACLAYNNGAPSCCSLLRCTGCYASPKAHCPNSGRCSSPPMYRASEHSVWLVQGANAGWLIHKGSRLHWKGLGSWELPRIITAKQLHFLQSIGP